MNASLISLLNSRLVYPIACFSSLHEYWIGSTSNVPSNPTPIFTISIHGITTFQVKPQSQESPPPQPTAFPSEPGQITTFNSKIYLSIFFLWLWSLLRSAPAFSPVALLLSSYPISFSQIVNQTISLPASQKGNSFSMFLKNKSLTNSSDNRPHMTWPTANT